MAKKSKIVKNDRRRATVARATPNAALSSKRSSARRGAPPSNERRRKTSWHTSPGTPARCGCATATPSTGDHAATSANSGCRGSGSANWHTPDSSRACGRRAGNAQETCADAQAGSFGRPGA